MMKDGHQEIHCLSTPAKKESILLRPSGIIDDRAQSRSRLKLSHRPPVDTSRKFTVDTRKPRTDCGVYLPDLEHKRPPDMPPGMVKLRLVVSK